jgi:3-phosphoglycerate kinase
MKKLNDFNLKGKKVLVRCDFNVPLDKRGYILDDFKIRQTLPTIKYLLKQGARIILMSHLGNPGGRINAKLSLKPVAKNIAKSFKTKVFLQKFYKEKGVKAALLGEMVLLENLRFYPEEEQGKESFARKLASFGDVYVNDAFAVCHRSHASLLVPKFLPSAVGLLLEKELSSLGELRDNPQKPLVVVLGGNPKGIETKIKLIRKMTQKSKTTVLLGNLIADELSRRRLGFWQSKKVVFPIDSVEGLDIGPKTLKIFKEKISQAKTIFWSGPLGKIEEKRFARGSFSIAKAIIKSHAFSVAGGGETSWFLNKEGLAKEFSHISTGGDAMLLFLAGEKLPGLVHSVQRLASRKMTRR